MTFLYRELDIDNIQNIHQELRLWYMPRVPKDLINQPFAVLNREDFVRDCDHFMSWANAESLEPVDVVVYSIMPGRVQPENEVPHTDTSKYYDLALNFAIANCEGTHTGMYAVTGEQTLTKLPNGITYWKYNDDAEFTELARFDLSKPTLFNTKVPHRVVNPMDTPRISASIRFKKDPWHLTTGANSVTIK